MGLIRLIKRSELVSQNIGLDIFRRIHAQENGKIGYILLWLLGIPIPLLIIIYLIRGN